MAFLTTFALSLIFVTAAAANDESVVTIPLDQIWALDMPGTRDVHEIVKVDAKHVPPHPSTLDRIVRSLLVKPKQPMSGYAVPGTPSRGVFWASKALRSRDSHGPIPTTEDVNLAFFAQVNSYRARLLSVRRNGLAIYIEYRFVPQYSVEPQVSFALIPLGQLPAGLYNVKLHQTPLEQKYLDDGFEPVSDKQSSHIVCGPFSFEVYESPAPDSGISKDAIEIPLDQIWARQMPGTRPMITGLKSGNVYLADEGPLLEDIRRHLRTMPEDAAKQKKPDIGFVVSGRDMEAMRKAHAILIKKGKREATFYDDDEELSLGFYSYSSTWYVHIHDVAIEGRKIKVRYKFTPHQSRNVTSHFALIPLKVLKKGEYEVTYERFPMDKKHAQIGWPTLPPLADKLICGSFKFSVREKP